MLVIDGKPLENISIEHAEAAIWEELEKLKNEPLPEDELTKVKNKTESTMVFSEMSLLEKTMNLAYFELMGDAENLNHETEKYLAITAGKKSRNKHKISFRKENAVHFGLPGRRSGRNNNKSEIYTDKRSMLNRIIAPGFPWQLTSWL